MVNDEKNIMQGKEIERLTEMYFQNKMISVK